MAVLSVECFARSHKHPGLCCRRVGHQCHQAATSRFYVHGDDICPAHTCAICNVLTGFVPGRHLYSARLALPIVLSRISHGVLIHTFGCPEGSALKSALVRPRGWHYYRPSPRCYLGQRVRWRGLT